jgi:hypothetical protein
VVEVVDPGEALHEVPLPVLGTVAGFEVAESLVFGEEGGEGAWLEGDNEAPAAGLAEGEDGLIGVEGIQQEDEAEAGIAGVELLGEPGEGLEFAVLLGGPRVAVLDELGPEREGEAVGGDELGLQDVVVVERFAVGGLLREAVRADRAGNAAASWRTPPLGEGPPWAGGGGPAHDSVMVQDRQAGLRDLVEEPLHPRVFHHPCSHLAKKLLGDVEGPGLPPDLPGQDVGLVG